MRATQTAGRDGNIYQNSSGGGWRPPGWLIALIVVLLLVLLGGISRNEALQIFGVNREAIQELNDGQ